MRTGDHTWHDAGKQVIELRCQRMRPPIFKVYAWDRGKDGMLFYSLFGGQCDTFKSEAEALAAIAVIQEKARKAQEEGAKALNPAQRFADAVGPR